MATGWAVAASTVLALSVGRLVLVPPPAPSLTAQLLVALLVVAAFGAWAYAISMAAHGQRGALVALLGKVLAWGLFVGMLDLLRFGGMHFVTGVLLVLVAIPSAWSVYAQLRARRGPLQGATAAVLLLPTVLLLVLLGALGALTP